MVVVNFKLSKGSKIALIALGAALILFILISVIVHGTGGNSPKNGQNTADRLQFLSSYGYTCDGMTESEKKITLPSEFDDTYEIYNAIQIEQGYDLKQYAGREVTAYTYVVADYEEEDEVNAHLLVLDGRIIGGDISSASLDGFMHGIVKATQTYKPLPIM